MRRRIGSVLLYLWTARFCTFLGDQVLEVAAIALTWELTGSSTATAAVTFAGRSPFWIFALPAGVIADRWRGRRLLVCTGLFAAASAATIPILWSVDVLVPALVGLVMFTIGTARILESPTVSAQVPLLAPPEKVPLLNTIVDNTKRAARVIGASIGTISFLAVTSACLFGIAALAFTISAAAAIGLRPQLNIAAASHASLGVELKDGWNATWKQREIRLLICFCGVYTILHSSAYWVFIPRILLTSSEVGALSYAAIVTWFALGSLISNIFLSLRSLPIHYGTILVGMVLAATAFSGFALDSNTYWLFAAMGGAALPIMDIGMQNLIHHRIESAYWGRTFSCWRYVAEIGIACGLLLGGTLADVGLTGAALWAGPMVFVLCALLIAVALRSDRMVTLRTLEPPEEP